MKIKIIESMWKPIEGYETYIANCSVQLGDIMQLHSLTFGKNDNGYFLYTPKVWKDGKIVASQGFSLCIEKDNNDKWQDTEAASDLKDQIITACVKHHTSGNKKTKPEKQDKNEPFEGNDDD